MMMRRANDILEAYHFSADTSAMFAFVIGAFLGLAWPFLFWGLVHMMASGDPNAITEPVNHADAMLQAYDSMGQLGPLRYLVWLFLMFLSAVGSGFVCAIVVFLCKHRWRG
jgi:hypothetical protein